MELLKEKTSGTSPLSKQLVVTQPGYVYLYLSNDNVALGGAQMEVYFDDFKVEHIKSKVIQTDDYYPFGLTFNSFSRESSIKNQYQYNGKEMQDELSLGWLDYGARMYMPEIGRWGVVDPLSEKMRRYSPYAYGGDDPVRHIDPDGMFFRIFGEKEDRRQVRQWLREIKNSSDEGRRVVRSLRWSLHQHNIYAIRTNYPGTHGMSDGDLKSQANGTATRDKKIATAIEQNHNTAGMKNGRSATDKDYIDQTASGGRPTVINNSLANILQGKATKMNAYNGKGSGSSMFINLASTDLGTFAHEVGHQAAANSGTMDSNSVKLALKGYSGDWTRMNDEKAADSFAKSVVPGYQGYHFTQEDQNNYDKAVKEL